MRCARFLIVREVYAGERCRHLAAGDNAAHAAIGLLLRCDVHAGVGRAIELHVDQLSIPQDRAGVQPVRRLIFHGQRRRYELGAHVVDADGLRARARFAQFVLRQGGIHHHPVHVAVGVGRVFAEVDAKVHGLRRPGGSMDDEVAAHRVFLQLQHPIRAVDGVDVAIEIVGVVDRRAVRPTRAAALVAVVHRAVRAAQRYPRRIPATGFAAVVPQMQHPTVEVAIAAVVVDHGPRLGREHTWAWACPARCSVRLRRPVAVRNPASAAARIGRSPG